VTANFTSLERWGADGLAARLDNGDLAIIRSDIVSQEPSAIDLVVSIDDRATVNTPSILVMGQAFTGQGIASVKVGDVTANTSTSFASWNITIDALAIGENTLTFTATSLDVPPAARTITRKIFYVPNTANAVIPDSWLVENFGSAAAAGTGASDDPDHDGQVNFVEYLFGTNPNVPDAPYFAVSASTTGIAVEIRHRDTPNFAFDLESSTNLTSWRMVTAVTRASPNGSNCALTTYAFPASAQSAGEFYRVRAVQK
jgi:hypothetical protein